MSLLLDSCPGGLLLEPPEPATSKFDYLALSQKLYSNYNNLEESTEH